jgi:hypothetical protein
MTELHPWTGFDLAKQALGLMVLDIEYTDELPPTHGHTPIRHQLLWDMIEQFMGKDVMLDEVRRIRDEVRKAHNHPIKTNPWIDRTYRERMDLESGKHFLVTEETPEITEMVGHILGKIKKRDWHFPTAAGPDPKPPYYVHMGPASMGVPDSYRELVANLLRYRGFTCKVEMTMYGPGWYWALILEEEP